MNSHAERWERWWFQDAPASRLAVLRVLVGGFALKYVFNRPELFTTPGDPSHYAPVGLAWYLPGPLLQCDLQILFGLTCISGLLFILGLKHRYTGPVFALSLLLLMCYRNSWGMVYHSMNLLVLHVLVLALARSSDAWSLDAWLAARKEKRPRASITKQRSLCNWRYGWPIQLICLTTMLSYFISAVAKLSGDLGLSWVWGEALRSQIAVNALRKELLAGEPSPLASVLYEHVWLFTCAGFVCLLLELGAPLFLWKRRTAQFWALSVFLMHWAIVLIMDIKFRYHLAGVAFASFFAVEYPILMLGIWLRRLGAWLRIPIMRPGSS